MLHSKAIRRSLSLIAPGAVALGLAVTSARALTIDFNDSAVTDALSQSEIQTAVSTVESLYSNPITASVLFQFSSSVFAETNAAIINSTYAQYTALLAANSLANPANTVLSTAVANLPNGNDAKGSADITATRFFCGPLVRRNPG